MDGHIILFDPRQPESVDSAKQVILVTSGDVAGLPVIAIATTPSPCRQADSGKQSLAKTIETARLDC